MNQDEQSGERRPSQADLTEMQFQALIRAAQNGVPAAFGNLMDACQSYLLAIARQAIPDALQSKFDPHDLLQSTALEAHRTFDSFRGTSQAELLAWLRSILVNKSAEERRRYQQTAKRNVRYEVSLESLVSVLEERNQSADDRLVEAEQWALIQECLDRLPSDMKRAIVMRHHEHRSFAEIGGELERSAEAARKLWGRGLRRLQRELNGENPETD